MRSRRELLFFGLSLPLILTGPSVAQQDDVVKILDEDYPKLDFTAIKPFGSYPPDAKAVSRAQQLANGAPNGSDPLRIVRYFIDAGKKNPDLIAQTPKDQAWNPLILVFFTATDYQAKNDMVPWCSAFVNWCLQRSGKKRSGSAASQSFLRKEFVKTANPKIGDLAVFTCYDIVTGETVGLGHVAFVAEAPTGDKILLAGGNQSTDGRSMICQKYYPLGPVRTSRKIGEKRVPVDFKLNTYISM